MSDMQATVGVNTSEYKRGLREAAAESDAFAGRLSVSMEDSTRSIEHLLHHVTTLRGIRHIYHFLHEGFQEMAKDNVDVAAGMEAMGDEWKQLKDGFLDPKILNAGAKALRWVKDELTDVANSLNEIITGGSEEIMQSVIRKQVAAHKLLVEQLREEAELQGAIARGDSAGSSRIQENQLHRERDKKLIAQFRAGRLSESEYGPLIDAEGKRHSDRLKQIDAEDQAHKDADARRQDSDARRDGEARDRAREQMQRDQEQMEDELRRRGNARNELDMTVRQMEIEAKRIAGKEDEAKLDEMRLQLARKLFDIENSKLLTDDEKARAKERLLGSEGALEDAMLAASVPHRQQTHGVIMPGVGSAVTMTQIFGPTGGKDSSRELNDHARKLRDNSTSALEILKQLQRNMEEIARNGIGTYV